MSNQYIPNSSQEYGELIAALKEEITTHLRNLLTKMLNDADEKLLDMADSAAYSHEKDVYYMLKQKLMQQKADVAAEFMTNILPLLRPYAVTQAEEAAHKVQDLDDELSLIGQDDMEDLVLVKNVGTETASKFREQITHLETRLDHLALKSTDIFAKNALAPMKICQAFDDTLLERFDLEERKVLFKLFKDAIAEKLDILYDGLNKEMIQVGILPTIKAYSKGRGARPAPSPQPQAMDIPPEEAPYQGGEQPPYGEQSYGGGYAATAAPGAYRTGHHGVGMPQGGGAPGTGMPQGGGFPGGGAMPQGGSAPGNGGMPQDGGAPGNGSEAAGGTGAGGFQVGQTATPGGNYGDVQAAPGSAPAQTQTGTTGGGFSGTQAPPDAQGVYQHQTAGIPASVVSSTLGNFLGAPIQGGGAKAAHSGKEVTSYPVSTAQHFGHDEILSALSSIQALPQFASSDELRFDAEMVKQALLSAIAKKSGGIVTKRINQIAEKTIDFIELVFEAIIEDGDISDTIKALLLRLQIPVIKASMIDQEFFIYDDHPARILLDRIAEVGMGVTEHSDEIYIRLDRIVNQLISEYELDTETFQTALDKVNEFVEERDEIARAKEEEAQQQALREHARNSVLKSLRNITAGKTLPEATHTLLLKRWPTLMFNHYLENGKENDGWVSIVEVLRDVVESVQPFKSAEDLAYLVAEKDNLIERVNQHLSQTYKSKKDIQQVVSGLIEVYDDMISDANYQAEEIQAAEQTIIETPREKEPIKPEPAHVPTTSLPSNIMPGMWFQISTGKGNLTRRCKLSVVIVEDEKLIFVTHNGEVVAEKSFEEFTKELDKDISKVIMGHSVFDYALNSVITKLEPTKH